MNKHEIGSMDMALRTGTANLVQAPLLEKRVPGSSLLFDRVLS